jgi:hypothetical protein
MPERVYSETELTVLDRFFTGVKTLDNIYAAKHTLPMPMWAFLTGSYSRSTLTMREKFLVTIKELEGADRYDFVIEELAIGHNNFFDKFIIRAEKFLSKWAVDYGHASLKDSCADRFAIEGVSIFGAKLLEWPTLSAAQEKSTRYADFSHVTFVTNFLPDEADASAFDKCLNAYQVVFENAFNWFYTSLTKINDETIRNRTARAKAFDIARYMLPVATPTSLGLTLPSRETEHLISNLLSMPFDEAQMIGRGLVRAGQEVNPALLTHVVACESGIIETRLSEWPETISDRFPLPYEGLHSTLNQVAFTDVNVATYQVGGITLQTDLEGTATHPRWLATAAGLVERFSLQQFPLVQLASALADAPDALQEHIDMIFQNRGQYEPVPSGLGVGQLIFSGFIDFGAWRDLQRHRRGFQFKLQPTTRFGYQLPEFIVDHDGLLKICEEAINAIELENSKTKSEYFVLLAHNVQFTYVCTVEQAIYLIELRTSPAGHISYRRFAQDMAKCLFQAFPELERHVRVCWEDETDRRQQEEARRQKLRAVHHDP